MDLPAKRSLVAKLEEHVIIWIVTRSSDNCLMVSFTNTPMIKLMSVEENDGVQYFAKQEKSKLANIRT